jgi:hypothetical protein
MSGDSCLAAALNPFFYRYLRKNEDRDRPGLDSNHDIIIRAVGDCMRRNDLFMGRKSLDS